MSERIYQAIIGVLVLVILVGGALMVGSNRSASDAAAEDTSGNSAEELMDDSSVGAEENLDSTAMPSQSAPSQRGTTASGTMAKGDSVSVVDQDAGASVVVESITLLKLGWVAIRDERGWILGAERLEAGSHSIVSVTLLRSTIAGASYEAVLYVDDGDKEFDLHKDSLVMKSDGHPVSTAFLTK